MQDHSERMKTKKKKSTLAHELQKYRMVMNGMDQGETRDHANCVSHPHILIWSDQIRIPVSGEPEDFVMTWLRNALIFKSY